MGKTYERLDTNLTAFIKAQKIFFVATAPLSGEGSVNLSPKGYDSLVVLDDQTVAYVDLGGSGAETLGVDLYADSRAELFRHGAGLYP